MVFLWSVIAKNVAIQPRLHARCDNELDKQAKFAEMLITGNSIIIIINLSRISSQMSLLIVEVLLKGTHGVYTLHDILL